MSAQKSVKICAFLLFLVFTVSAAFGQDQEESTPGSSKEEGPGEKA